MSLRLFSTLVDSMVPGACAVQQWEALSPLLILEEQGWLHPQQEFYGIWIYSTRHEQSHFLAWCYRGTSTTSAGQRVLHEEPNCTLAPHHPSVPGHSSFLLRTAPAPACVLHPWGQGQRSVQHHRAMPGLNPQLSLLPWPGKHNQGGRDPTL